MKFCQRMANFIKYIYNYGYIKYHHQI